MTGAKDYVGGLVGFGPTSLESSVALNRTITGDGVHINRLTGAIFSGGTLGNNYAWSGMPVNTAKVTGGEADNIQGQDVYVIDGQFGI